MEFTPLTIIAGTNASGKSNLFDALLLLSRMAEVDLRTAFSEQRGDPMELFTQVEDGVYLDEMEFVVEMLVNRNVKDNWGGSVALNNTRLRYTLVISRSKNTLGFEDLFVKKEILEKIRPNEDRWLKKLKGQMKPKDLTQVKGLIDTLRAGGSKEPFIQTVEKNGRLEIRIRQDTFAGGKATPANTISQTVLGGVVNIDFPHVFAVKEEMRGWQFLQLSPEDLRRPTKQEPGIRDTITSSGKNMAAVLYRLKNTDSYILVDISRRLNTFLPDFIKVDVINDEANHLFVIKLKDRNDKEYTSRVLSEGTLRLLLLCILEYDDKHKGLLCFEEPENGINPYRIKALAQLLKDLTVDFLEEDLLLRQVIANTHSPVLVGETIQWRNDHNVSVHYAEMRNKVVELGDRKVKIGSTKIIPVSKQMSFQTELFYTKQERQLTLSSVKGYLETANVHEALDFIN